jgi:dUTP pyrophosphatase
MILTGSRIIKLKLVQNVANYELQVQPCGIDFSLKRVCNWNSSGVIDFDNSSRRLPRYNNLDFENEIIFLKKGGYLVEFNESVALPKNIASAIHTRSSLFRSGVTLHGGVIDPGYVGAVGALMQVWNENGITLTRNARLAQCVFTKLEGMTDLGYSGVYQNAESLF